MKIRLENPLSVPNMAALTVIAAVFLNAALAFINARGVYVGQIYVIAGEVLIAGVAGFLIALRLGAYRNIYAPLLFIVAMSVTFLWVSLMNGSVNPKAMRDMLMIVIFFMLGGLFTAGTMISAFRFTAAAVLAFMLVEAFGTNLYVWFFEPAQYFANTRGIAEVSYDESGLFMASLGYEGRFSYNILNTHRLSSTFLEQVSLGNFAIILSIFTSCFWKELGRRDRIFFLLLIPFIIVTTSSRMASILCTLILMGHFIFPFLPRLTNLLYLPLILVLMFAVYFTHVQSGAALDDNFIGRLTRSALLLTEIEGQLFTGGGAAQTMAAGDAGFSYIVLTQTCIGLVFLWLFNGLCVAPDGPMRRRFLHGSALYIFANLSVSGTAVFSIKTAAMLWALAGFLRYQEEGMKTANESREGRAQNV